MARLNVEGLVRGPRAQGNWKGPGKNSKEIALMAKALGHPVRVAIVRLLRAQGSCICGDIVERLPVAQATVSQHLKVLKNAGLLKGQVDGPRVCYCLDLEALERFKTMLEDL